MTLLMQRVKTCLIGYTLAYVVNCIFRYFGAFAKSRKATISFDVCLSVRMEQLGPTGRIFMQFDI